MRRVAIVAGVRTPFVKAGGVFGKFAQLELGLHVVGALVRRSRIDPQIVEELAFGSVLLDPRTPNLAREIVLRSGLPSSIVGHFVSNNCISGCVAVGNITDAIATGRISVGIAGGVESMSRPTLTMHPKGESLFIGLARARSLGERLALISSFRPRMLLPVPPSPKEPSTGLTMGQHCELSAKEFKISREEQDAVALHSHQQAGAAQHSGILAGEIEPFAGVDRDNLVREDTSAEKLAKLAPVFDRTGTGTITAGNASALTDGASAVLLMAEDQLARYGCQPLAWVEAIEYAAVAPAEGLLMAPGLALPRLLQRTGLSVDQIDRFEIHEAFGAQVACNLKIWREGWSRYPDLKPIGAIPAEKINVHGGSIAIGHPFAATGGRLVTSLALELQRTGLQTGVISVCAAGGMAAAMLVRRG